jgi:hypothetical protein
VQAANDKCQFSCTQHREYRLISEATGTSPSPMTTGTTNDSRVVTAVLHRSSSDWRSPASRSTYRGIPDEAMSDTQVHEISWSACIMFFTMPTMCQDGAAGTGWRASPLRCIMLPCLGAGG